MLAILLSFCTGVVAAIAGVRLLVAHRRETARRLAWEASRREQTIRAELVDHQVREMLGSPRRPYFTAEAVAEARRALEPMVVIKVKP